MAATCDRRKTFDESIRWVKRQDTPKSQSRLAVARDCEDFGATRHGKVYTEVVEDCSKGTILAAIRGKVDLRSVIHSDGFKSYDGLVDMGYKKHLRVDHSANEFSSRGMRGNHINGIEGFWGYAKTRMARFRGMHPHTFYFHLKECEFRYNHRRLDLYHALLKLCRENPLS